MKNNEYKSLEEVWEMKDKVYEDFQNSGLSSYAEFIRREVREASVKYNIDITDFQKEDKTTINTL